MTVSVRAYARLLARYLGPQWPKASLLAFLVLTSIGLQVLNPRIVRDFIDAAVAGAPLDVLARLALFFFLIAAAGQGLTLAAWYVGEDVGWRATNRLRADLALHCLRLDLGFHNSRTPGEMIERIDGDVTAVAAFFSQLVIRVIGSMLLLVGVLIVLFQEDLRVGLALSAFALVSLFALIRTRNFVVPAQEREREASAQLFGFVEERLAGIDDVRSSGGGAHAMRRLYQLMRTLFERGRVAWRRHSYISAMTQALFASGYIIAMALGGYLFVVGAVTLGTVYLIFQYTEMLRTPIEQLTRQMQDFQRATAGIVRIRELFETTTDVSDGPVRDLPSGPLPVAFDDVTFRYEGERAVVDSVSFAVDAGRVLGLVGRTGSGKTTLTRLLFRLYDPADGSIRLGGTEVRDLALDALRSRVAMVTQEVQLFHASVRDNLTMFDESVPDERIVEVLQRLGLGEWLASLAEGIDTVLAPGGGGVSAGQAQLLAVARAFLADPSVVVLDEPSSRLDPASERAVERAFDMLLRGRTAIVIAHRLATVDRADDILVLEDGRVREHGPREVLAADPSSRFSQLLRVGMAEALA